MRRAVRDNGLTLFFTTIFFLSTIGHAFAGWKVENEERSEHGEQAVSLGAYVLSSDFGRALLENWQSEFLQFALFIYVTIWLVQRGSNESKEPEAIGRESPQKQRLFGYAPEAGPRWAKVGGWRTTLYSNSLMIAMSAIFVGAWAGQAVTAWRGYNEEQQQHDEATVGLGEYLVRADFWERTLQNWQSEFLAVGTMAIFTVYLRQRGSPESKPVGAPHDETASSG